MRHQRRLLTEPLEFKVRMVCLATGCVAPPKDERLSLSSVMYTSLVKFYGSTLSNFVNPVDHLYSLASSFTVPMQSLVLNFLRTDSLWYCDSRQLTVQIANHRGTGHTFQNCLLESLPHALFRIFGPPGCSEMKLETS